MMTPSDPDPSFFPGEFVDIAAAVLPNAGWDMVYAMRSQQHSLRPAPEGTHVATGHKR